MKLPVVLGRDSFRKFGFKIMETDDSLAEAVSEILNIDIDESEIDVIGTLKINDEIAVEDRDKIRDLFFIEYIKPERPEKPAVEAELTIRLKEHQPFRFAPRRLSFIEKQKLIEIIKNLITLKRIKPSDSEYASAIVLVKMKNGEMRLCIDFRVFNKFLIGDNYPLPLIDDQLDILNNKKYFFRLDLKDAFHHISIAEDSQKYTSFVTPIGQFEFTCMPFGLKVAPSRFQRFINTVFKDLIESGDVVAYIDDLLIATVSIDEHIVILRKVFRLLIANKMELRTDKCEFLSTKIEFLGYVVSESGISPTTKGIEAVTNFPEPRTVKDVQSFLGVAQYFRKFVEKFSLIAKPLYDLLKKGAEFNFKKDQYDAFKILKAKLAESPILAIYDP